mmetsp:Transcript_22436/g.49165  ORF Transcript_22436/g.49165 Transcript_22436/m.49165 type:complete len:267 (+) Transcript_22436:328-1128(+)
MWIWTSGAAAGRTKIKTGIAPASTTAALFSGLPPPAKFRRTPTTCSRTGGDPLFTRANKVGTAPASITIVLFSTFLDVRLWRARAACFWTSDTAALRSATRGGMTPAAAMATFMLPSRSTLVGVRFATAAANCSFCSSSPVSSSFTAFGNTDKSAAWRSRMTEAGASGSRGLWLASSCPPPDPPESLFLLFPAGPSSSPSTSESNDSTSSSRFLGGRASPAATVVFVTVVAVAVIVVAVVVVVVVVCQDLWRGRVCGRRRGQRRLG